MKLSETPKVGRFFGLFVGPSGSGKTSAAASFPKPEFLDFDMRYSGAKWTSVILSPEEYQNIEIKVFTPQLGFSEVEKRLEQIQMELSAKPSSVYAYQTLVMDSLTSLERMFLTDAAIIDPNTKKTLVKGKTIGVLRAPGPADYSYLYSAMYQSYDYIRSFPINVISMAHVIDKFGKPQKQNERGELIEDPYAQSIVTGEQLSLTNKLAANVLTYFDEVYRFGKEESNGRPYHWVKFRDGDLARTVYPQLPDGKIDITGKNFYQFWKSLVEKT